MDIDLLYMRVAYAALLFIFAFCGALRRCNLWPLSEKNLDELYPARKIVMCVYFSVVLLLPCVLHPQSTDARLLARCFWILFVPAATALSYKRFFFGDARYKRLRVALIGGVPLAFMLVLSCVAMAGGDVLMPHKTAIVHAAGILGALLTAYEIHVMLWLWHIRSGADAVARAADRLFPSNFASGMLLLSSIVLVFTWVEFLMGDMSLNTFFTATITLLGAGIIIVILHPQRVEKKENGDGRPEQKVATAVASDAGTVPVAMPSDTAVLTVGMKADEDAFCIDEETAEYAANEAAKESATPKEKKYTLSEAQLDCIEEQIRKVIEKRRLYLNPHLKRDMIKDKLDINRSYLSEVFARRLGSLNQYVNLLRMEYAVRYAAEHPGAKLTEVARCSGFGSMTTFYRTKANYETWKLSQANKESDNSVDNSNL